MQLDLLRSFIAVVEQGSLNRAAERLRVSQSTLTRQMQSLEAEVGGRLLERSKSGVALTGAGHVLEAGAKRLLADFEQVLDETRRIARGKTTRLRIGYITSAAAEYLHPALIVLRREHPEVKVILSDLSPGEQLAALRAGELDLALVGTAGAFPTCEFYLRRLASVPVLVAMADNHPLAAQASVRVAELRKEIFVGALEKDLPGYNQWLAQLGRRAGIRLRRRLEGNSLTHGLALVVSEGAVAILPEYVLRSGVPGVVFKPLRDSGATWELAVVWQRGRTSAAVQALIDALPARSRR